MSYYFAIVGTKDNPVFEHEFGTSKSGGDGQSRFLDTQRRLNQFIVHAALDIVEEVQWGSGNTYLKYIDRHQNSYISTFLTPTNQKLMLLYLPPSPPPTLSSKQTTGSSSRQQQTVTAGIGGTNITTYNPTAPVVEEAMKNFFLEIYEGFVKTSMNPFYVIDMPIRSPVFRARVAGAAKKYL